ncbi:MAG: glutamate--cysteine ligase [Aeromicrobium sp.]|nr:glutamate--cysteine ligase [Aeromicrobium sp.]
MKKSIITRWAAAATVSVASLVAIPAAPAGAAPTGHVIINELYVNGGSANAAYKNKFVELYNPGGTAIDISDWSLQYRGGGTRGAFSTLFELDGIIAPGQYFLVAGGSNGATGADLPTPDQTTTLAPANGGGTVALVDSTDPLPAAVIGAVTPDVAGSSGIVDLLGYGTTNTFEGAAAPGPSATSDARSINRTGFADTDSNASDFTLSAVKGATPVACGPTCVLPAPAPLVGTIAEIQGTGPKSPQRRGQATTKGVVTAVYKTGGFSGAYLQTPGTGGPLDLGTHAASDGVFVFGSTFANAVDQGDYVEVTGKVVEYQRMTELTSVSWTELADVPAAVEPAEVTFPLTEEQKESLEGMLLAPKGPMTVTDNYATNQYGEIGLAPGAKPLDTPTNVVAPGPAAIAKAAQNAAALVTLDDAATTNYLSAANQDTALPWLRPDNEVRVGAPVTFTEPVVLDFRNYLWKLQPREQVTGAGTEPVTFGSTRKQAPEDVGGKVKLATFNVLNYFTTTGADYVTAGGKCSYYNDRDDNPITTNECGTPNTSSGNGPRGAADAASLARQQAKIVNAINTLDADVVSLEEIENSAALGKPRDTALDTLVAALNADAGAGTWAAVPSPATVPTTGEDVIRTALIYRAATLTTVGTSTILDDPAFVNARAPLAQAFTQVDKPLSGRFAVIVNHFKSKGSGSGADADQGDGQGASNQARTRQATALIEFAADVEAAAGTDKVFLTGDFNAYNEEDPVRIIEDAGFVNLAEELTDKETYQFDGAVGSLDHVFASAAARPTVTGTDIWNINSYEALAREYSRYNYNVTNLYDDSPFRASDHDPEIVGFDASRLATTTTATAPASVRSGQDVTVKVSVAGAAGSPSGEVTVSEGGTELGRETLAAGTVDVVLEDLPVGSHLLTVSYAGDDEYAVSSGEVTTQVLKATSGLTATAGRGTYGTSAVLTVTGQPGASGLIRVAAGDELAGWLTNGTGSINLSRTLPVGTTSLTVFYDGNADFDPTSTTTSVTVAKAATTLKKVSVSPSTIVRHRTKPFVTLSVKAAGFTVDGGKVTVRANGKSYTGAVRDGKVRIRLGRFTTSGSAKKATATFSGNGVANGSTTSFTVKVRKK